MSPVTIPAGHLPLPPQITPGWGVAGMIMILTGAVYTLVGIKNRWIHSFFSTAYITALGVAVLIVYVMNVPVSNGLQGGYVAAIILSGCALGAASMFFKEITEGLGCALGGFCMSMWLLTLLPGGLLHSVAAKAIFIASFTVVGFAFYFSRYTRDWALIVTISFAGATVTVLGIDCYSRAGLKEFWAYVWHLNDNLFPLGADTYPVTKGIRVETAAIIILCIFGIISQIKLWRIVREQREKRAAERAEGQRNMEEEEENVGRQIEETTARDRREWERVYGEGTLASGTVSRYSGVGDASSEKGLRSSNAGSTYAHSKADGIELSDMSDTSQAAVPGALMASEDANEGKVTVRVAADDVVEATSSDDDDIMDEKAAAAAADGTAEHLSSTAGSKRVSRNSKRTSRATADSKRTSRQQQTVTPAPEVVPLPFTVPDNEDTKSQGDRSSVATFADEDVPTRAPRHRQSLVKRLSQSSVELLRSLSQRAPGDRQRKHGESSEDLVEAPVAVDDDASSIAATFDGESVSCGDRQSIISVDNRKDIEITANLAQEPEKPEASVQPKSEKAAQRSEKTDTPKQTEEKSVTPTEPQKTESPETAEIAKPQVLESVKVVDDEPTVPTADNAEQAVVETPTEQNLPEPSEKAKSVASVASGPIVLTKDRLPRSLSRVAMSYRTNEWAKHLSLADAPEPDELHIDAAPQSTQVAKEVARVVDVDDLQMTAETGVPPTAVKRSASQASYHSTQVRPMSRTVSKRESASGLVIATNGSADIDVPNRSPASPPPVGFALGRTSSIGLHRSSSGFQPIVEEQLAAAPSPTIPEDAAEDGSGALSPTLGASESFQRLPVPGVVSYSSPQTLIGQRETFLRNRSQGNLLQSMPEPAAEMYVSASDNGSLHNYPMYAAAFNSDPDDLPLSQRKEIMRQSSLMALSASNPALQRSNSGVENSEGTAFDSHQPKRQSSVPTIAAREARLASFRQSVAQDLRVGSPPPVSTPMGSTSNLLNGIDTQRNMLMGQKEADAQRREMQRREKEWQDRVFDNRMRSGDLLEAHREVLRKMQSTAKE